MKLTMFHFMPHRNLPTDFRDRYSSVWIEPPWGSSVIRQIGDWYDQSLEELMLAARLGFDGIGVNEHHQNTYGMMCEPNLFAVTLARLTRDEGTGRGGVGGSGGHRLVDVAADPAREEYATIDCIGNGRLIAGLPLGLGSDSCISDGIPPLRQRER